MSVLEKNGKKQTPISRRQLRDFIDSKTNTLHPNAKKHLFESLRGQITSYGSQNYVPHSINGQYLRVCPRPYVPGRHNHPTVELLLSQQMYDPLTS